MRNAHLFATALLVYFTLGAIPHSKTVSAGLLPGRAGSLLSTRCVTCHNGQKRSGGIDLTTRALAIQTSAITPGKPQTSRMVQMVAAGKMPPDGPLNTVEIDLIRKWIAEGAQYPRAILTPAGRRMTAPWSFQPVRSSKVPHSRFDHLSANPVDRFLFAALDHRGLAPAPLADRRTLIRRVTLDLTGLLPTPMETESFVNDRSPIAYENVVNRLLASSAYGERWGRHWLDIVRYGESDGYETNHLRENAWPYRDYVIRAFNDDISYPDFVAQQLAGDIVGKGDRNIEVATGFLVDGIHDTVLNLTVQGTRQQRANDLDDIVTTTGATFLGLTINCAHCHDHKFDPISQSDYYHLAATFAGVRYGERPLPPVRQDAAEVARTAQTNRDLNGLHMSLNALESKGIALWTHGKYSRDSVSALHNEEQFSPVRCRFLRFTVLATTDGSQPCLDELQVFRPDSNVNCALSSTGATATASSLLPGYTIHQVSHLNDGRFGNDWSWISNEKGGGWAEIEFKSDQVISRVVWSRDAEGKLADRLASTYKVEVSNDGVHWTLVADSKDRLPPASNVTAREWLSALSSMDRTEANRLNQKAADLRSDLAAHSPIAEAYIGQFTQPDPTFILPRGDVMRPGTEVSPGALTEIPGISGHLETASATVRSATGLSSIGPTRDGTIDPRLALARWICSSSNPLTARVMVNRVWGYHFGQGIVSTPSDFGNNGAPPSNRDLLDWLASNYMVNGWRLKRLQKLLVTSYTYRESSRPYASGMRKDAGDALLWRMPLQRMDAEAIRDTILETSGKLDRTMGGPSFPLYTYQVVNVAIYGTLKDQGPNTWRRSVYREVARGIQDDLLGSFDCPDSAERTPQRTSTTTALQSLTLLNGQFITEQAGCFAARVAREAGSNLKAQVAYAFRLAYGRLPDAAETAGSLQFVARYGLPSFCRALFNTNEFLYY